MGGYLPNISTNDPDVTMIREFRGYNHNPVIGDGEFYQQKNMSSDAYPLLSCRTRRVQTYYMESPHSMIAADHMAWIANGEFYYNGEAKFAVEEVSAGDSTQMVRMGAYICIFPQGVVYNTQDGTWEDVRLEKSSNGNVNLTLVFPVLNSDGKQEWKMAEGALDVSDEDPYQEGVTKDGDWWVSTGITPSALRKWSETQQMWVTVTNVRIAVSLPELGASLLEGFYEGDGIEISGIENNTLSDGTVLEYESLNGTHVIQGFFGYGTTKHAIVIDAPYMCMNIAISQTSGNVTITRRFPEMDFVCEMGNRLFGCSSQNHEIYASKLGDPLNWNVYQGASTDSYAATVGSPGTFTGCIGYRDSVLFFKEDRIHILTGTRPATFQIDTLECNGVERMSSKSMCIVNETLFYKASDGFYAYSGGLPQYISDALGEDNKGNVISSGGDGTKYYACQVLDDDDVQTIVYDTRRGFWNREDEGAVLSFALLEGHIYMLKADGVMWALNGYSQTEEWQMIEAEDEVEFSATTGMIGLDSPFGKYIGNIRLRVEVERGAVLRVLIDYDESGQFREVARINGQGPRSILIPIKPNRCDTMRIRFAGRVNPSDETWLKSYGFKLYSMSFSTEQGGEV